MQLLIVLSTTIIIYFVLYGPQPLLPLFAHIFSVTDSQAALLMTLLFLPLSLAPLSYGYLLQSVSSVKILRVALFGLALSTIGFVLSNSFSVLLTLRFVQGLLLPAILTSIMTYISANAEGVHLQRVMSIYVTTAILGGYLGRFLSGTSATYFSWQTFFWVVIVLLLLYVFILGRFEHEVHIQTAKPKLTVFLDVLQSNGAIQLYLAAFCLFFVFASLTTFLPFRLPEILDHPSEFITGLMYSGYLIGILTSLGSQRLCTLFGSQSNALLIGFSGYIVALLIALVPNVWILFIAIALICAAMFLLHPVAATMVNQQAGENRGIVNGLYLTFYYAGGTLGSYIPGLIYQRFGWQGLVMLLIGVSGIGLGLVWNYGRREENAVGSRHHFRAD